MLLWSREVDNVLPVGRSLEYLYKLVVQKPLPAIFEKRCGLTKNKNHADRSRSAWFLLYGTTVALLFLLALERV